MLNFLGDLRLSIRTLAKVPVVVIVTVLSLGFGIALATTIFTMANTFLLRSPTGASGDLHGLVAVYTSQAGGSAHGETSFPDYLSMAERIDALGEASPLDEILAFREGMVRMEVGNDQEESLRVEIVTGNYFDVLSIRPPLGRAFLPEETLVGSAEPVAVISHQMWRHRFGADPAVLGESMALDGIAFTIVGVAPEGMTSLALPLEIDAWLPLGIPGGTYWATPRELADRDDREYGVMGRLRAGATIERTQAQFDLLADALHSEFDAVWEDDLGRPRRLTVLSERGSRVPPGILVGFAALTLMISGMILFIACSNVAGMFLARADQRACEMAVRLALGASRRRLVRLLLTESLVLGLVSGAFGVALAHQAARWAGRMPFLPVGLALKFDFSLDYRVLLFAVFTSVATSVVFGLAPALEASKPSLTPSLKTVTGATGPRPGRFGLRNLLVMGQFAVSLVFLVSAGLVVRTMQITSATDLGVNPARIASMTKWLDEQEYPAPAAQDYFDQVETQLMTLPGVEAVHSTLTAEASLVASVFRLQVEVDGHDTPQGERSMASYNAVTPGYMEMLGIEMLRGRTIAAADEVGSRRVAIVNEAFADRYWPEAGPMGRQFRIVGRRGVRGPMPHEAQAVEIVGVARNASYAGFGSDQSPFVWLAIAQDHAPYCFLHVKSRSSAEAAVMILAREVPVARGELPLIQPTTYEELINLPFMIMAAASRAIGYCGAFALLLAAIGIYGIVSFAVGQRRHEMTIRQAVGAMPQQVIRLILRDGMFSAACGLVAGLVIMLPITRLLATQLPELSPFDPLAVLGSVAVLTTVALVATLIPARRVIRLDAMNILREE